MADVKITDLTDIDNINFVVNDPNAQIIAKLTQYEYQKVLEVRQSKILQKIAEW